jgi:predicted TIM-barrel fold metal-dependent hydrolase
VLEWTAGSPTLFPFYWIDPTEKDAIAQVKAAAAQGIAGFKIICSHHYPCDPRAMKTYAAIAQAQKPILFHSGILWDGQSSSKLNRPTEFEGLLEVKGLRFALAHVSWPWHDECIAMFGKIQDAIRSRKNLGIEMFFDLTPGTPMIYREEVLRKLFTIGYKVEDNILFGIDTSAEKYDTAYAKKWVTADMAIMKKLKVPASVQQKVFSGNVKRFIGA